MGTRPFSRSFSLYHDPRSTETLRCIFAFLLVAWGLRIGVIYDMHIIEPSYRFKLLKCFRGFVSDIACVSLLSALCVYILRLKPLSALLALAWCQFVSGNHAYITVNDENLSLYSFGEGLQKAFLLGSALSNDVVIRTVISYMAWLALYYVAPTILAALSRRLPSHRAIRKYLLWAPASLGVVFLLAYTPLPLGWISSNVLENFAYEIKESRRKISHLPPEAVKRFVYKDLSGTPLYSAPSGTKPNVLLIAIEGLSAEMMEWGWLPRLKARVPNSLWYEHYLSNSDRTINGIYSLLCGDYPRLYRAYSDTGLYSVSKLPFMSMNSYCIPRLLNQAGYNTLYMQATTLNFDHQNHLNVMAGFKEQFGKYQYKKLGPQNEGWGPNDEEFMKRIEKTTHIMERRNNPWFIMALSVGTHHPYIVPKGFATDAPTPKQATFMYMDIQLDALLQRLEEQGILDNTLVIITNDEASGVTDASIDNPLVAVHANRGFLMVLTPKKDKAVISNLFMSVDIFLSIADYLNLSPRKIIQGRSIFREYDTFRPILFGSALRPRIIGMLESKRLIVCSHRDPRSCTKYQMRSDDLFENRKLKKTFLGMDEAQFFIRLASTITERSLLGLYQIPTQPQKKTKKSKKS